MLGTKYIMINKPNLITVPGKLVIKLYRLEKMKTHSLPHFRAVLWKSDSPFKIFWKKTYDQRMK